MRSLSDTTITFHPMDMTCFRNMLRSSLPNCISKRTHTRCYTHVATHTLLHTRCYTQPHATPARMLEGDMQYQQRQSIWARLRGYIGREMNQNQHSK